MSIKKELIDFETHCFETNQPQVWDLISRTIMRIAELEKDQLDRDALIMANARSLIKLKARSSNGRLYGELFGTGHGTARQRCRELGLDPDCNKTCYNEMINFQRSKGGAE